jgi:hypothetical protein
MALPLSGQISMNDIRVELGVPSQSPFGLNEARSGTYATINPCSTYRPPATGQVSLSSWYGYNHTQPCPNCVISVTFDVDSAGTVSYLNCCEVVVNRFFGIGPQVINDDCIKFGTLIGGSAIISFINYSTTTCECPPTPTPTNTPTPTPTPTLTPTPTVTNTPTPTPTSSPTPIPTYTYFRYLVNEATCDETEITEVFSYTFYVNGYYRIGGVLYYLSNEPHFVYTTEISGAVVSSCSPITPTPTPTPTPPDCECITILNEGGSTGNYTITNCNGTEQSPNLIAGGSRTHCIQVGSPIIINSGFLTETYCGTPCNVSADCDPC